MCKKAKWESNRAVIRTLKELLGVDNSKDLIPAAERLNQTIDQTRAHITDLEKQIKDIG